MVDVHGLHNEVHLIHMLRVADSGDDLGTSQLFGKGSDDNVLFVAVRAGDEKIKITYGSVLEQTYLFGISRNSHDIILLADFIKNRLVHIKHGYGVVAAYQSVNYLKTEFAGPNNCNPHNLTYLKIILNVHYILPHYIKFASVVLLLYNIKGKFIYFFCGGKG